VFRRTPAPALKFDFKRRKIMKTFLRSFVLVAAVLAGASSLMAGKTGENGATLKQLAKETKTLEATAETAASHRELAAGYRQLAHLQLEESNVHAQQAAWYAQFPIYSSTKFKISTIDHCRYFAEKYRQDAQKSEQMAIHHERLAG
jgi:hypothetical protein